MQTANDWMQSHGFGALCVMVLGVTSALTLLGLAIGFAMERLAIARGMKIYAVALRPQQLRHEALGTALFHLVFVPFGGAVLALGWVHFSSGLAAQLLSFAVPWWGFQLFYYWVHRLMHVRKLRWIHRWHHRSQVTTPLTGLSMHPVEALLWCVLMWWPRSSAFAWVA
jgi:Delta7-sterol 5-desaturase